MLPGRSLSPAYGTIASLSAATLEQPSTARGDLEPAPPGTFPDKFVAVAVFDNRDGSLVPGMVGKARVYSRHAAPVSNLGRILRRWIQTLFW